MAGFTLLFKRKAEFLNHGIRQNFPGHSRDFAFGFSPI
jgi:hypothetical protein